VRQSIELFEHRVAKGKPVVGEKRKNEREDAEVSRKEKKVGAAKAGVSILCLFQSFIKLIP
jgi:hypothetical protein